MTKPAASENLQLVGRVGTLRCSQLFAGMPAEDLATIAGFAQPIALKRNDYLFYAGEPSRGFYLVQSGAVNVHRVSAAGKEQVIHIFRAGESFAEASLSSPTGYPANARCAQAGTVLLIPKPPMLDLLAHRPDLALRMLGAMSVHLRVLVGMLDDLKFKDLETRLLNWLVKQSRAGAVVRLPGTKRELAAELGTTSETLSRTLGRLRDQKLITVAPRSITVLQGETLARQLRRNLGES